MKKINNKNRKYNIKTKNAVKSIIDLINVPLGKRKLSFLFGAGINFNIATGSMNWDDLSKNALKGYLKSKKVKKRYTEFEVDGMTEKIIDTIQNNKVILSFGEANNMKLNIKPFSSAKNRWFINGYKKIMKKMNGNVDIFTLNYDLTLETIFSRKDINLLVETPSKTSEEVIHLHGVIDASGSIVEDSLLTLKNYVDNSKKIEDIFSKHLLKGADVSDTWETIIIIGSSMQEEHLLRVLKDFKEKNKFKNIILLDHLPNDKFFISKVSEIYDELSIKLVNINSGQSYKNDFMDFWEILSNDIHKGTFLGDFEKISLRNDFNELELYNQMKARIIESKTSSLSELLNILKFNRTNNTQLIRPVFWLEKEKFFKKRTLKQFVFKNFDVFPVEALNFIMNDIETYDEKIQILNSINILSPEFKSFGYHHNQYESMNFLEKFISDIDEKDFMNFKDLIIFLIYSIIKEPLRIKENIKEYISKIATLEETLKISNSCMINYFPSNEDVVFKIMKKEYENNNSKALIISPKSIKEFAKLLKTLTKTYYTWQILYFFIMEDFSNFVQTNYQGILKYFMKYENISLKRVAFSIVYFVLINNKKYNDEFLIWIKSKKIIFDSFPDSLWMLGHGGTDSPTLSKYDGKLINSEIVQIKTEKDFFNLINEKSFTLSRQHSIIEYIRRNISIKFLEKISKYKSIETWWYRAQFKVIVAECKTWDEYLGFIKVKSNISFIKIKPPFDIHKRTEELANVLVGNYNEKEYVELIKLLEIKHYLGHYKSEYFWWNREIRISMKYKDKDVKYRDIILNIFRDVFKWNINNIFRMLDEKPYSPKGINEVYFILEYGNKNNLVKIDKMISLFEKEIQKNPETISVNVFIEKADWIIRSNPKREEWNNNFVMMINFLENIQKKYNYSEIPNAIRSFYHKICYNTLIYKVPKMTNNIKIRYVFNVIFRLDKLYEIDEEIVKLLNTSIDDNSNDAWWYLSMINNKKIGKMLRMWIFEKLIIWIDGLNNNSFIHNGPVIMEFIDNLDNEHKQEILNKIKERDLDLND